MTTPTTPEVMPLPEPQAWFEWNAACADWFLAYSARQDRKTRPLFDADQLKARDAEWQKRLNVLEKAAKQVLSVYDNPTSLVRQKVAFEALRAAIRNRGEQA